MNKSKLYRSLPNVNTLLDEERLQKFIEEYGREVVKKAIQLVLMNLREEIRQCEDTEEEQKLQAELTQEGQEYLIGEILRTVQEKQRPSMRRVINGTGTILHTNLGRSPICEKHMEQITAMLSGYSNLEYDLKAGQRGKRYDHFEDLLCKLTGAEAAMAVNNNAASVLLILSALAKGGETVISHGELIEIGGKFRIPDVLEQSGSTLAAVGTTNKTHLEDYERAITENTKMILKVHTSNYKIIGFTESVDIKSLAPLAKKHSVVLVEDMGSGSLINLEKYGLSHEPTVQESIAQGADLVCFSGDKLLGGPQAGIIVGKKRYMDILKQHPLTRAVRVDKFTVAALELVLREYLSEERAVSNIPALRMIARSEEEIVKDAKRLCRMIKARRPLAQIELRPCCSQVGGGSLPQEIISSMAVSIVPKKMSVTRLEEQMRYLKTPMFGRIVNDELLLDVRTLDSRDFKLVADQLAEILS